jgi:2-dehydro-3-deoxyphosphogluconate aldolase / (4S)-4-hydroxy-2-oxoglutarate aldolase
VVAVVRMDSPDGLVEVSRALATGGVHFVEITMTVPSALDVIRKAVDDLDDTDVYIGAGTVLDGTTATAAMAAGARFIVSPGFDWEALQACQEMGVPYIPGALTPTEVLNAWKHGAAVVKIFPADIGGPEFISSLREPLPQIELMPTKGIDFQTAGRFIKAGAIAVGVGSALVSKEDVNAHAYHKITENARRFVEIVRTARKVEKK